jgi:hypothetical protein
VYCSSVVVTTRGRKVYLPCWYPRNMYQRFFQKQARRFISFFPHPQYELPARSVRLCTSTGQVWWYQGKNILYTFPCWYQQNMYQSFFKNKQGFTSVICYLQYELPARVDCVRVTCGGTNRVQEHIPTLLVSTKYVSRFVFFKSNVSLVLFDTFSMNYRHGPFDCVLVTCGGTKVRTYTFPIWYQQNTCVIIFFKNKQGVSLVSFVTFSMNYRHGSTVYWSRVVVPGQEHIPTLLVSTKYVSKLFQKPARFHQCYLLPSV